jgi:hypothetical protein
MRFATVIKGPYVVLLPCFILSGLLSACDGDWKGAGCAFQKPGQIRSYDCMQVDRQQDARNAHARRMAEIKQQGAQARQRRQEKLAKAVPFWRAELAAVQRDARKPQTTATPYGWLNGIWANDCRKEAFLNRIKIVGRSRIRWSWPTGETRFDTIEGPGSNPVVVQKYQSSTIRSRLEKSGENKYYSWGSSRVRPRNASVRHRCDISNPRVPAARKAKVPASDQPSDTAHTGKQHRTPKVSVHTDDVPKVRVKEKSTAAPMLAKRARPATDAVSPNALKLSERFSGTWKGEYLCDRNRYSFRLTVKELDGVGMGGVFAFSTMPGNLKPATGSFTLKGGVYMGDSLILRPGEWIKQPSGGYRKAGINAKLNANSTKLTGNVFYYKNGDPKSGVINCGDLNLVRVAPARF